VCDTPTHVKIAFQPPLFCLVFFVWRFQETVPIETVPITVGRVMLLIRHLKNRNVSKERRSVRASAFNRDRNTRRVNRKTHIQQQQQQK
jgi:hypothetical protein